MVCKKSENATAVINVSHYSHKWMLTFVTTLYVINVSMAVMWLSGSSTVMKRSLNSGSSSNLYWFIIDEGDIGIEGLNEFTSASDVSYRKDMRTSISINLYIQTHTCKHICLRY